MNLAGLAAAWCLAASPDGGVGDGGFVPSSVWLMGPAAAREPQPSDPPLAPDRRFLEAVKEDAGPPLARAVRPGFDRLFPFPGPSSVTFETGDGGLLPPFLLTLPLGPEQPVEVTGLPAIQAETGRSVEVVNARELARTGVRTTADALQDVPGVLVTHPNYFGGRPTVRGLSGDRVQVRVDGIPLGNTLGPAFLETVDPWAVEQVEVLKGPAGVEHGAGALGGVVSIREHAPQAGEDLLLHSQGVGFFQSADQGRGVRLSGEGGMGPLALGLGGDAQDFQDLRGGRGIGAQRSTGYGVLNLQARSQVRLGTHAFSAGFDASRVDRAPFTSQCIYGFSREPKDCLTARELARDLATIKAQLHPGGLWDQADATLAYERQSQSLSRAWNTQEILQRQDDEVRALRSLFTAHTPRVVLGPVALGASGGMEVDVESVDSAFHERSTQGNLGIPEEPGRADPSRATLADGASRGNAGMFLLGEATWAERVLLRSGVRAEGVYVSATDRNAQHFWPLPSAMGQVLLLLGQYGSVGVGLHHGSRAPSLAELSGRVPTELGLQVGNPHAGPEDLLSGEGVVHLRAWRFTLDGSLFAGALRHPLTRQRGALEGQEVVDGRPVWVLSQDGHGVLAGGEGQLDVRLLDHGHAGGSVSVVQGEGLESGHPLEGVPPPNGVVWLGYRPPRGFYGEARVRWVLAHGHRAASELSSPLYDPSGTPRSIVVGAGGGWQFSEASAVDLWAENVTDENYRLPGSGVRGSAASVRAQVRLGF